MSSELGSQWAPATRWAKSIVSTTSVAAGDAAEGRSSRRSLDLNQKSGEIKPELVKKYLSETNMSRGDVNKRALAEERAAFARDEHDTGSSEVQIANLTMRIKLMTEHLREHGKDTHSRHGLMAMRLCALDSHAQASTRRALERAARVSVELEVERVARPHVGRRHRAGRI